MSANAIWFLCGAAAWLVTGLLAYSLLLGHVTAEWPEFSSWKNSLCAGLVGLYGPIGLVATVIAIPGFFKIRLQFRFRLRHLSPDEVWRARAEKYPEFDREWWLARRWEKPAQETRSK